MLTPTVILSMRRNVPGNMMRSVIAVFLAAMLAPPCYATDASGIAGFFMFILLVPYAMWVACLLALLLRKELSARTRRAVLILSYAPPMAVFYVVFGHGFGFIPHLIPMSIVATFAGVVVYRSLKSSNEAIKKNRLK